MIGLLAFAAALLLGGAGSTKLVAPRPAAALVRVVWSRCSTPITVVRVAGVLEIAVAVGVVLIGNRAWAGALACCYFVFAAITVRLVRRGHRGSCGCFGRAESPVGRAHLVLNTACVAVSVAAAIRPPGRFGGLLADGALHAVVGLGQAALLAYAGFLSITALPALAAARRQLVESR